MATFSNCLQIINAMPQQDQDALLARLDELQAQGMSPKEAQLQAAIDVLAQVEREGEIRKSAERGVIGLIKRATDAARSDGNIKANVRDAMDQVSALSDAQVIALDRLETELGKVARRLDAMADSPERRALSVIVDKIDLEIDQAVESGTLIELTGPNGRNAEGLLRELQSAGGIRKSASRVTDTPEFKRWFGDSKVVDENGEPLVVYHGTSADFSEFKTPAWFAYAAGDAKVGGVDQPSSVIPAYLSVEDPYVLDEAEMDEFRVATGVSTSRANRWAERLLDKAIGDGHDGLVFPGYAVLVPDSAQIKSATGNNGEFDPANPSILKSVERPQFYSQLQRAIEQVPARLDNMGAPAWKQWLTANASKLGVKAEEVEWSGIKDFLDLQGKKKLSKEELSRYLDESGVKIGESVSTDIDKLDDERLAEEYWKLFDRAPELDDGEPMPREEIVGEIKNEMRNGGAPDTFLARYEGYSLPGGDNYREVLITLPPAASVDASAATATASRASRADEIQTRYQELFVQLGVNEARAVREFGLRSQEAEAARKALDDARRAERNELESLSAEMQPVSSASTATNEYLSSHWDQANVLAHIRVNDRTDADGKRVLFVEEVQSDWGQEGKKKGFRRTLTPQQKSRVAALEKITEDRDFTDAEQAEYDSLRDGFSADYGLPSAPFVTKTEGWLNLALKRIAMMAVEGGYDKVAFVNGEQSADRYDLSKSIESIGYDPKAKRLEAYDKMRNRVINQGDVTRDNIEDYVGKEVAKRLLATEPVMGKHLLDGEDIKVGGEGMKTFYDQIVPQAVSKLLPKIGGEKLGAVKILIAGNKVDIDGMRTGAKRVEQPGFNVTDKMRETVGAGLPLFSRDREEASTSSDKPWFDDLSKLKVSTNYQLGDLLKTSKKLSWWDRTVGTQYNLAQKHPEFKRVFDAVQTFINDVSAFATRAADMAQDILPKLETWRDIGKAPLSAADVKALRDPIFGGTLSYTRDEDGNIVETDDVQKAGVVFTDEELRSRFNLTDKQIDLYRQFRKATDQSITDLALSDMLRYLGEDGADIRESVMAAGNVDVAVGIIKSHLEELAANEPQRAYLLGNITSDIEDKAEQANRLMDRGYAPLSRFGQYTVYAVGQDGEQIYFSMFENERDANKMAREMQEQYPDATVTTGTMSQESYKLFSGVTPETLALFGEALGLEESGIDTKSEAYQTMLKVAKTNRSAMKRLIQRKGIDGFSEDAGRVLAGFVYSNARQISTNLHAGEIGKSASEVKDGDLKDQAIRLMEYIQNPQEEAQAIRGLLFTQFIGGSVASAMVNMTQPFTMTLPYLSQFGGAANAGKAMADALKLVSRGIRNDDDLKQALKRAEDEGVVSPQEVHQLMAQAQGSGKLQSGDGTRVGDAMAKTNNFVAKLGLGWGKLFSAAEQFNRRVTFIAAYKTAREQGIDNPFAFAQKAIAETQGVYNKGNKPNWARGAVGGTLFTFKQYSIAYVEFLRRMWGNGPEGKKAVGLALAVLFMTAGLGGMPGADDLDDVIDGFAQRVLGKSFDSKQAKKEFFASILGQTGAEFVMGGLTGIPGAPIDLSGRMGLGNLIPGTGILTKKKDYGRDVSEVFGPAGTFFSNIAAAAGNVAQGDVGKAVENLSPVAIQNVIKATDMATMGMYRDQKGRKVIDVDGWEAAVKAIGFQPASVKRIQDATSTQQGLIAQNKLRETEIADKWAAGRIERNPDKVEEAKAELAEWNRKNPESPISIDQAQINRRVQQAMMDKAKRLEKTAPKEIRQTVRQELERAN